MGCCGGPGAVAAKNVQSAEQWRERGLTGCSETGSLHLAAGSGLGGGPGREVLDKYTALGVTMRSVFGFVYFHFSEFLFCLSTFWRISCILFI